MVEYVERERVVAFRLAAHHLDERLPEGHLSAAAGRCGIQNSPPGSALLALHARVDAMTPGALEHAVDERSLVQTWSMRGAPYHVPTGDLAVFTAGVLPVGEEAQRHFLLGVGPSVDRLGMSLTEATALVTGAAREILSGRRLPIGPLGTEIAERIAPELTAEQRMVWRAEGPHAAGQPIGEAVVHFCLRFLALHRTVCFAPREGNKAPFALTEEWLGHPVAAVDPEGARAELLRRYLHCYGPSTRAGFAGWLGLRAGDVGPWWDLLVDELVQVGYAGTSWLLAADLDGLRSATRPDGVRLLPPRDPYLQLRDRATLVDPAYHREMWRAQGDPGAVLVDGEVVGSWRPRKSGRRLHIEVKSFAPLSRRHRDAVVAEAERLGPLRGAEAVSVGVETY